MRSSVWGSASSSAFSSVRFPSLNLPLSLLLRCTRSAFSNSRPRPMPHDYEDDVVSWNSNVHECLHHHRCLNFSFSLTCRPSRLSSSRLCIQLLFPQLQLCSWNCNTQDTLTFRFDARRNRPRHRDQEHSLWPIVSTMTIFFLPVKGRSSSRNVFVVVVTLTRHFWPSQRTWLLWSVSKRSRFHKKLTPSPNSSTTLL